MSFERVDIGDCILYRADCLDVLPSIGTIDTAITSPPYNRGARIDGNWEGVTTETCKANRFRGGYGTCSDDMPWGDYRNWLRTVMLSLWLNHKSRIVNGILWTPAECLEGLPIRQSIIWHTGPGVNFMPGAFVPSHELVFLVARNGWRFPDRSISAMGDVWQVRPESTALHPAPFPVEIPSRCIAASGAKIVIDPFMGTGTTGIACIRAGCKFVGIEIDKRHFDSACQRISEAWGIGSLIEQPAAIPELFSE